MKITIDDDVPDLDGTSFDELMTWLRKRGGDPVLFRRGFLVWRVHLRRCGNWWRDGRTPLAAAHDLATAWDEAGRPTV